MIEIIPDFKIHDYVRVGVEDSGNYVIGNIKNISGFGWEEKYKVYYYEKYISNILIMNADNKEIIETGYINVSIREMNKPDNHLLKHLNKNEISILETKLYERKIMLEKQRISLKDLCERYNVEFIEMNYTQQFDLPKGYVAGWVGPIYVGCSKEGRISS